MEKAELFVIDAAVEKYVKELKEDPEFQKFLVGVDIFWPIDHPGCIPPIQNQGDVICVGEKKNRRDEGFPIDLFDGYDYAMSGVYTWEHYGWTGKSVAHRAITDEKAKKIIIEYYEYKEAENEIWQLMEERPSATTLIYLTKSLVEWEYLEMKGEFDMVITNDSDLIMYGFEKILLFNLDLDTLSRQQYYSAYLLDFISGLDESKILPTCLPVRCDYIKFIPEMDITAARDYMLEHRDYKKKASGLKELEFLYIGSILASNLNDNSTSCPLLVMGNMFCTELRIHRRYDLKGSSQGRFTNKDEIDERVLH
ncbi:hypothetical protein OROMI_017662 [Orobanche minor]